MVTLDTAVGKNSKYVWVVTFRLLLKCTALRSLSNIHIELESLRLLKEAIPGPLFDVGFENIQEHCFLFFTIMSSKKATNQSMEGWKTSLWTKLCMYQRWREDDSQVNRERERAEWKCNNDIRRRQVVLVMSCPITRGALAFLGAILCPITRCYTYPSSVLYCAQ